MKPSQKALASTRSSFLTFTIRTFLSSHGTFATLESPPGICSAPCRTAGGCKRIWNDPGDEGKRKGKRWKTSNCKPSEASRAAHDFPQTPPKALEFAAHAFRGPKSLPKGETTCENGQPHEVPQRRVARCPRAESLAHPADPRESSPLAEAKGFLSLSSTTLALKRQDRWQGKQDIPPRESQGA